MYQSSDFAELFFSWAVSLVPSALQRKCAAFHSLVFGYDPTANGTVQSPCQSRRRRFASSYRIAERTAWGIYSWLPQLLRRAQHWPKKKTWVVKLLALSNIPAFVHFDPCFTGLYGQCCFSFDDTLWICRLWRTLPRRINFRICLINSFLCFGQWSWMFLLLFTNGNCPFRVVVADWRANRPGHVP